MHNNDLVFVFEDNTITLYKNAETEKIELVSFIVNNIDYLTDDRFAENIKNIIIENELQESYIYVVLNDSLFYSETKIMPKLPFVLLYRAIREELNFLFTREKMRSYSLKMISQEKSKEAINLTFLLSPTNLIKNIKIFLKKLPNNKFEIQPINYRSRYNKKSTG